MSAFKSEQCLGERIPAEEVGVPVDGWEQVPLAEVITASYGGGTPSTKNPSYWNGEIPWTTSAHLNGLHLRIGAKNITELGLKESSTTLVPKGNLLVGTRVGVGKVAVNLIDVAISQDLTGLIIDPQRTNAEYVAYALMSDGPQETFRLQTRGTTIKGIPREDLLKISIFVPPLDEQRRIARVLSTIRRAIEAQDKVIAAARELKCSLMKHLFTYGPVPIAEASRVPLKETEIGPVPEHWETIELGEEAEIVYGIQAAVAHLRDRAKGVPILTNVNITRAGSIDLTILRYFEVPINKRDRLILRRGDLLFNWRSGSREQVGKTALFDLPGEFTFSSFILRLRTSGTLNNRFLLYYLHRLRSGGYFAEKRQQSSVNSVFNASLTAKVPLFLPSTAEQIGIAEALQAADNGIAAEEARKTALQALFKSMLHHLMTGKIRVPESAIVGEP